MASQTADIRARNAATVVEAKIDGVADKLATQGHDLEVALGGSFGVAQLIATGELYATVVGPTDLRDFANERFSASKKLDDVPPVDRVVRQLISTAHPHASPLRRSAYDALVSTVVDAADPAVSAEAAAGKAHKTKGKDGQTVTDKGNSLIAAKRKRDKPMSQADARKTLQSKVDAIDAANKAAGSNSAQDTDQHKANEAWKDYTSLRAFAAELGTRNNLYSKSLRLIAWQFVKPYWPAVSERNQTKERLSDWCAVAFDAILKLDPSDRTSAAIDKAVKAAIEPLTHGDGSAKAPRAKREVSDKEAVKSVAAALDTQAKRLRDLGRDGDADEVEDLATALRGSVEDKKEDQPVAPMPVAPKLTAKEEEDKAVAKVDIVIATTKAANGKKKSENAPDAPAPGSLKLPDLI